MHPFSIHPIDAAPEQSKPLLQAAATKAYGFTPNLLAGAFTAARTACRRTVSSQQIPACRRMW